MKLIKHKDSVAATILSEGKILEVTPMIEDAVGRPYPLPSVTWNIDNWLVGYEDTHVLSGALTFYSGDRIQIPASNAYNSPRLYFVVRILERSEGMRPNASTVDAETVRMLVDAMAQMYADMKDK